MLDKVPYKVLLPDWIFQRAKDNEELKRLILEYMKRRYPDYQVKKVRDRFAICEHKEPSG